MNRDPELPGGFQDADFEMRELYAAGARAARGHKAMMRLRAAGQMAEASRACQHGSGYNTDGGCATFLHDPRAGQAGMRCSDCGSFFEDARSLYDMRDDPESVTVPCEFWKA
jgi:hypothetical protein